MAASNIQPASVLLMSEHKGVVYPNVVLHSSVDAMQTFTVRPDDVWIVTYPKSGTHWMKEIVNLIHTRGDPEKVDHGVSSGTIEMINLTDQTLPFTREEELQNPLDTSPMTDVFERAPSPRVITSHLTLATLPPILIKTAKVIYVARNPKDVLKSFYTFSESNPASIPWETFTTTFMDGRGLFGPWEDHVKSFWKVRDSKNVFYCFYEDMKRDPLKCVRLVAEFLNESLSDDVLGKVVEHSSFSSMKKTYDKIQETGRNVAKAGGHFAIMNKGEVGGWKNIFTVAQNESFDNWLRDKMSDTELKFTFE